MSGPYELAGGAGWTSKAPEASTFNILSRIFSMAWDGSKPFGQTSVQFMI
jgi:hypothetical protein